MVRHGRCWFQMGWRSFGFVLLEEMQSGQGPVGYWNETRRSTAAQTLLLDLRKRSDDMQ
jgi:hypothetical protein